MTTTTTRIGALSSIFFAITLASPGCVLVTDFGRYATGGDGGVAPGGGAPIELDGGDGSTTLPDASDPSDADAGERRCAPACGAGERCVDGECRCGAGASCGGASCCDGACVDTSMELAHCGGCGMECPGGASAIPACTGGECALRCESGYDDCNRVASDGCEANLGSPASCGACGNVCAAGERCASVGGSYACRATCPAGTTDCGGSCVDLSADVAHCGRCDAACASRPGASRTCAMGACSYACAGDFADCDGDLASSGGNGCEIVPPFYYRDADGDGVGVGAASRRCPSMASGYSRNEGDCDDGDAARYPGAPEACNGRDEDCDMRSDESFAYMGSSLGGACTCEAGARSGTVVCGSLTSAACMFPAEACNGADDDCDGVDDDGFECASGRTESCTVTAGACTAIGTRRCASVTCTWNACELPAETCDGVDQNCDGFVDEGALRGSPRETLFDSEATLVHAVWRDATRGGAAVVFTDDASGRRAFFQAFDARGRASGAPRLIASGSGLGWPVIGWDGERYAIFYSFFTGPSVAELRVVRVDDAGSISAPTTLVPGPQAVYATSGPAGVAVAWPAGGGEVRAALYASGAWTRAPFVLLSTSAYFDSQLALTPHGADFVVAGATPSNGAVVYRTFGATTLGTQRSILTDANSEQQLGVATDPGTGRAFFVWTETDTNVSWIGAYTLATGANVGSPTSIGSNSASVAIAGAELFLAHNTALRRVRPSDVALYPESYAVAGNTRLVLATPGGPQRVLYVGAAYMSGVTTTQAFGCP